MGIRFTDLNGAGIPVTMTSIPLEGTATVGDLSFYITAVKTGPVILPM
uniref:Uncharacterized protein n=1 Tax=Salmonella enterica subsp. indica TaxID=59207 RepID=I3W3T9_SALER|nr:hypothetical protein [Salmonella enterica subsp. indica]